MIFFAQYQKHACYYSIIIRLNTLLHMLQRLRPALGHQAERMGGVWNPNLALCTLAQGCVCLEGGAHFSNSQEDIVRHFFLLWKIDKGYQKPWINVWLGNSPALSFFEGVLALLGPSFLLKKKNFFLLRFSLALHGFFITLWGHWHLFDI